MLFLLENGGQTLYVVSRVALQVKCTDCWKSTRTGTRTHKLKKRAYDKKGDPNPWMLYGMLFLLESCGQTLYVVSRVALQVKFSDCWKSTRTGTRTHKFKKLAYDKKRDPNPWMLCGMLFLRENCSRTLYVGSRVALQVKLTDRWKLTRAGTRRHKFKEIGVGKRTRSSPWMLCGMLFLFENCSRTLYVVSCVALQVKCTDCGKVTRTGTRRHKFKKLA